MEPKKNPKADVSRNGSIYFSVGLALMLSEGEEILFVKPQLFMNLSGGPTKRIIEKYNCDLCEVLVILDDINLPLGKIRMRKEGSSGGHNGLKSISSHLKTTCLLDFSVDHKDLQGHRERHRGTPLG